MNRDFSIHVFPFCFLSILRSALQKNLLQNTWYMFQLFSINGRSFEYVIYIRAITMQLLHQATQQSSPDSAVLPQFLPNVHTLIHFTFLPTNDKPGYLGSNSVYFYIYTQWKSRAMSEAHPSHPEPPYHNNNLYKGGTRHCQPQIRNNVSPSSPVRLWRSDTPNAMRSTFPLFKKLLYDEVLKSLSLSTKWQRNVNQPGFGHRQSSPYPCRNT